MPEFSLGDDHLNAETLSNLSRRANPTLKVSASAYERLDGFRHIVDLAVESGKTYYGINTGFGLMADVVIEADKLVELQYNLVRSHACGVGPTLEPRLVRALMILKSHNFLQGHSGVRRAVVEQILALLEHDILPVIPEQGSVGASGDLAPMAHMALALLGEGEVDYKGQRQAAKSALEQAGLKPLVLAAKEGLSLINGTQFMAARGAYITEYAKRLLGTADIAMALSLDAMRGTIAAFDERVHQVRQQPGQAKVAQNIRHIFSQEDDIMKSHEACGKVQDPYSFRCVPQVHGASRDAWQFTASVIERELNSITDNPLVFSDGSVISGGNFHGQPLALAMDFLAIAVAEIGSISERRIEKMTDPKMSDLPAFLIKDSGLNSGYMIPHVVAASLVSENKVLCHPASVDSIPTSADKEDHVSMGPIAAQKGHKVCDNVCYVLAIELLAATQGVELLAPLKPGKLLTAVMDKIRSVSPTMARDRSLHQDIEKVASMIREGEFIELAEQAGLELI